MPRAVVALAPAAGTSMRVYTPLSSRNPCPPAALTSPVSGLGTRIGADDLAAVVDAARDGRCRPWVVDRGRPQILRRRRRQRRRLPTDHGRHYHRRGGRGV